MAFPEPVPGLVIRYSYLWAEEHKRGREEGVKDRPCAIILVTTNEDDERVVTVLPISHAPPADSKLAVEIPAPVKRRLKLDDERSWVVLTEVNRFIWPGPDLRPSKPGDLASVAYGPLPFALFEEIRTKFIAAIRAKRASVVRRSE
ncbi:MAG TPA: hypothetical protein VJX48_06775 [Xanthobacteraceae bacterium]|nr:hypothetical protein [Xanthobacteraceae bacterium]